MRFMKRHGIDSVPVRVRRLRRLHRRLIYASLTMAIFAAAAGGSWYLDYEGTFAAALARFDAGFRETSVALNLTVQSVEVEGRHHTGKQAILAALQVRRGTPILDVDLGAAQARLQALPWVRSAAVERMLPNTIFVRLVEHRPLAVWQHNGVFSVIDQAGAVIPEAPAWKFPSLVQVVGKGAPQAAASLIETLATEPMLARHVTAAERIGGRRWNLYLDNGIEVELPENRPTTAWRRLAALDRSDRLLEREVKLIDLRLPNRLVLQLPPDVAKSIIKKNRPTGPNA